MTYRDRVAHFFVMAGVFGALGVRQFLHERRSRWRGEVEFWGRAAPWATVKVCVEHFPHEGDVDRCASKELRPNTAVLGHCQSLVLVI